jgi:hypothetical protein
MKGDMVPEFVSTDEQHHIELQFWFVLDHIMKGDMVPECVSTDKMLADGFTKPYSD